MLLEHLGKTAGLMKRKSHSAGKVDKMSIGRNVLDKAAMIKVYIRPRQGTYLRVVPSRHLRRVRDGLEVSEENKTHDTRLQGCIDRMSSMNRPNT